MQNRGLEVNQMLRITQVMCVLVGIQDQVQPISEYELLIVFYKVKYPLKYPTGYLAEVVAKYSYDF